MTKLENYDALSLGRFEVQRELGRGAFGVVYLASDPQLERLVALKVPHFHSEESSKQVSRFLREAKSAAGLHHPNIVAVHDAGKFGNRYYIASDFIEGCSLRDKIRSDGRPSKMAAARLVAKLADALGYAHRQGVVHRDVKPENILLERDGTPYLVDFGLARRDVADVLQTQEGAVLGTPAYMSPEQAAGRGSTADGRTDQWSLGIILYELLTGVRPFEGNQIQIMYAIQSVPVDSPRKLDPSIHPDLETICLRCLAKDPTDRFRNCEDLKEDLERWLSDEPITSRRSTIVERFYRWHRHNPSIARLSMALFATVALLGSYAAVQWIRAETVSSRIRLTLQDLEDKNTLLEREKRTTESQRLELSNSNTKLLSNNEALTAANQRIEKSLLELQQKDRAIQLASEERLKAMEAALTANERSDEERRRRIEEQGKSKNLRYFGSIQSAKMAMLSGEMEQAKQLLGNTDPDMRSIEWYSLSRNAARYEQDYTLASNSDLSPIESRFFRSIHFPESAIEVDQVNELTSANTVWAVDRMCKRWLYTQSTTDVLKPFLPSNYLRGDYNPKQQNNLLALEGQLVSSQVIAASPSSRIENFDQKVSHAWMSPNGRYVSCIFPTVSATEAKRWTRQIQVTFSAAIFDLESQEYFRRNLIVNPSPIWLISIEDMSRGETVSIDPYTAKYKVSFGENAVLPILLGGFDPTTSRFVFLDSSNGVLQSWSLDDRSPNPQKTLVLPELRGTGSLALRCEPKRILVASKDLLTEIDNEELKVVQKTEMTWPVEASKGVMFSRDGRTIALVHIIEEENKTPGSFQLLAYSRDRKKWKRCIASKDSLKDAAFCSTPMITPEERLAAAKNGQYCIHWKQSDLAADRFGRWLSLLMPDGTQLLFQASAKNQWNEGIPIWRSNGYKGPRTLKLFSDGMSMCMGFKDRIVVLRKPEHDALWQVECIKSLDSPLVELFPHPLQKSIVVSQERSFAILDLGSKEFQKPILSDKMYSVQFPTPGQIASSDMDGHIHLFSEKDGSFLRKFRVQRRGVATIAVDSKLHLLAATGEDRRIVLWDLAKQKMQGTIVCDVPAKRIEFNPSSKLLTVLGIDQSVVVYRWPELRRLIALDPLDEEVLWLNTSKDGKRLIVVSRSGIRLVDTETGIGVVDIYQFKNPAIQVAVDDSQTFVYAYCEVEGLLRFSL